VDQWRRHTVQMVQTCSSDTLCFTYLLTMRKKHNSQDT
jgi:hypothetical protein